MFSKAVIVAIALSGSTVLAHAAVPLAEGDVAGVSTALGIDPNVPLSDPDKNVIEPDANQMPSKRNAAANGLGTLNGKQKVTLGMLPNAVQNSVTVRNQIKGRDASSAAPASIPQVDKQLKITYRQMVLDGRFDPARGATVLIDPTATGNFQNAVKATINENPDIIRKPAIAGTTIVAKDLPMSVSLPDDLTCSGPQNTCLVRVVNGQNEANTLWGGHVVIQQVKGAGPVAGGGSAAVIAKREVERREALKRAEAIRIYARDGGVDRLAEQLKSIHVRDEPELDARSEDSHDPDMHATEADMLAFEKNH